MGAKLLEHEADGIQELDNPLPRWWLYLFYATIIYSIYYCIVYPSFWFWPGTSGWTQEKQWTAQVPPKPVTTVAQAAPLAEMAKDSKVTEQGKVLFMSNCASCHGNNGEGKIGPCLTDSDWKYGSSDEELLKTINKGRPAGMPAWGSFLKPDQVQAVAAYVHSISNTTTAVPAATAAPAATATPVVK